MTRALQLIFGVAVLMLGSFIAGVWFGHGLGYVCRDREDREGL